MKKFLVSSAVCATVLATSGLAKIANDGTGAFLIAPAYYAQKGFETKLKLVNTNLTHSVIYRAVVRESVASQEVDFFITLSPSDVWDAKIYKGEDGNVYIQSDDESTYAESLKTPVKLTGKGLNRTFAKGYVEFYPVAMYNEGSDAIVPKSLDPKKDVLYTRADNIIKTAVAQGSISTVKGYTATISQVDDNSVAGFVTLVKPEFKASMTLPMMAFEGVQLDPSALLGGPKIGFSEDTKPALYINPAVVYDDLITKTTTVPYENSGKNDGLLFTFWNDNLGESVRDYQIRRYTDTSKCLQKRSATYTTRDMEENRNGGVYISPAPEFIVPINCEHEGINIAEKLTPGFEAGMVKLFNISQDNTGNKDVDGTHQPFKRNLVGAKSTYHPSAIVTNMSAVIVDGSPSYSWNYTPVERDR